LPPGCGRLPGEEPDVPDNAHLTEAFPEDSGPYALYRRIYEGTECGASVGALIQFPKPTTVREAYYDSPEDSKPAGLTVYSETFEWEPREVWDDDLEKLGTWEEMSQRAEYVDCLIVMSIVEGADRETERVRVDTRWPETEAEQVRVAFADAVKRVEASAAAIWSASHGCQRCAILWHEEHVVLNDWGEDFEGADGCTPIHADCPQCSGKGVIL
jgi:hypothetical protein